MSAPTPMFTGALAFCSNFDLNPFYVPFLGREVRSAEHAFNAAKTTDPDEQAWVLDATSPSQAKQRGRRVALRPGWDTGVRVQAMQRVLVAKFTIPDLSDRLEATDNLHLVETNAWHDNFWGDCLCGRPSCARPGVNMLGELLMALRARRDGWRRP